MKTVRNWNDLKQFGIIPLTGEACALSCRLLCDLTPAGEQIVRQFLSLPYDCKLSPAWNSEGTSSVMLPTTMLADLAAFCLIETGCLYALAVGWEIHGVEADDDDKMLADWLEQEKVVRRYIPLHAPRRGLSNIHQMSGRSA